MKKLKKGSKKLVPVFLLSSLFSANLMADNYCAGIRGNGELAPAHWSSLARIIENKGMPHTVSGGSSAAITLFMLDALSLNQKLSIDQNTKNNEQALLLKTLVPHVEYLISEDAKAPEIMRLVGNITGIANSGFVGALKKALAIAKDLPTFMDTLGEYGPLLNPTLVKGLKENFSFYKDQIAEAASALGAFDALNDVNLFYRDGLVDFKYLGIIFGRVADFYAGHGAGKVNTNIDSFLNECSSISKGKEWSEIVIAKPICGDLLKDAFDSYYEAPVTTKVRSRLGGKVRVKVQVPGKRTFPNKMIFSKVGSGINALPTTSVITGAGAKRYSELKSQYIKKEAKDVGVFSIDFDTELSYGYWGATKTLTKIKSNLATLFPKDAKSGKFMGLKGGIWFDVLGTSPAEPGLSSLIRIPDGNNISRKKILNKKYFSKKWGIFPTLNAITWFDEKNPSGGVVPYVADIYSAGGWSDLHPTLVLKASGCEDIVYITRQGGESVFGQQIFIRLTGYTEKISFFKNIKDRNRDGWKNLTEEEENSPWNKLYNLANPNSSFNLSLKTANAVYCTDWDHFNIFKGEVSQTLTDAYHAPVFVKDDSKRSSYDFGYDGLEKSVDNFPGCILKPFN